MPQPEASHEQIAQLLGSIDIPACPANIGQVMAEAQKDMPDLNVLSRLIAADVGMATAALKLANSPLFRRRNTLDSVNQAVLHLGIRNILGVVIAVSLRKAVGHGLPGDWLEDFWRRAGQVAMAAGLLARQLRGVAPDTAYTYALLHDAAIPLMLKRFPDYLATVEAARQQGVDQARMETQRHGCTHAQIGGLLARNWGMSPRLAEAIRAHHDPDALHAQRTELQGQTATLIALVRVAEGVLDSLRGEETPPGQQALADGAAFLGLFGDDLADLRESMEEAMQA